MDLSKEINTILKEKFPILTYKDIDAFLNITTYKKFDNKDIIFESGKLINKVFYILKGNIRGYIINDKGYEKNIWIRSEGVFIGDTKSLFNQEPQTFSYKSIEETHILLFDYRKFEALALENKNLLLLYIDTLKEANLILSYRVQSMITMSPEDRYLDIVKWNPQFFNKSYNKYIADYLGITNVSLSRIINRIKNN